MTDTRSKNVIVVDDEASVLRYSAAALEDAGFTVYTATNRGSALDCLKEHEIGVVVLDRNLGNESGLELLREIRSQSKHICVLMHTAHTTTESVIEALQGGAFDYLQKPVNGAILSEKVERAWSSYELSVGQSDLLAGYETLFEIIPGIVWFVTEGGTFRRISKRGAALLEYTPEELVGKDYSVLLADDDTYEGWAFKERRQGPRATRRSVVKLQTKTGDSRVFELSSSASYDKSVGVLEDGYRGTLAVGWDITENLQLLDEVQQVHKMDALGRLAGGIAHDFNNLLSVITGGTSLARTSIEPDSPAQIELQDVERAAMRAAALTQQLLLFSRQEPVAPNVIGIHEVLENVVTMLRRLIRENIEVKLTVDRDVGAVKMDARQLEQVLVNLAVNGRDAMPNGGSLSIHATNRTIDSDYAMTHPNLNPGNYVTISVSDTGHGMSPEVRQHIFEPFFTTKDSGKGTGLGMAIVYGIVRQAGGHIALYSRDAVGTTVTLFLPHHADPEDEERTSPPTTRYSGKETILLVEDDEAVRRVAKNILARAGYSVVDAGGVKEALEAWNAHHQTIKLLVTDVVMKQGSGAELAVNIRSRAPTVPVIYMSGYIGNLASKHQLLTENAGFIQKPFTQRELLAQVRALIDQQEP